jgi:hypothetical protein
MKRLILLIIICLTVILIDGCIMLRIGLNEDGFHFGVEGDFPDIPTINYEKEIE